jgi:hypothetical protein
MSPAVIHQRADVIRAESSRHTCPAEAQRRNPCSRAVPTLVDIPIGQHDVSPWVGDPRIVSEGGGQR